MITLLIGENSFEIERALNVIINDFDGIVERLDGNTLQLSQLPDVLMGISLFSDKRIVIIKGLSENRTIWTVMGDWLSKISDDIHLVLIESKPDKRTSTFKTLKVNADVREFLPWEQRDIQKAEKWVQNEAENLGISLNKNSVQLLLRLVGFDQWRLFNALKKLSLTDDISINSITDIIEADPIENVFNLFETAVKGDMDKLSKVIHNLEKTEDVYRLVALLSSQVFQLAAVVTTKESDNVSKDFGIHPYVVSKLKSIANRLKISGVKKIISIFTELDDDIKISKAEPWLLVERALIKVATIKIIF